MNTEITFPVASILENTEAIVDACEDSELSSSSSRDASSALPVILLTGLAALIHLQQYDHARHLWRRYSSEQNNPQLQQFVSLWRAVAPLLRAHSQDFSRNSDTSNNTESNGNGGTISEVYGSLQACVEKNPTLEPLATYAKQLQVSIRENLVLAIERAFESIDSEKCRILLGFQNAHELDAFVTERKWTKEMGTELWIPCYQANTCRMGKSGSDRIDYLTNVVGFMETRRFNA
jgi:hypothetical protein